MVTFLPGKGLSMNDPVMPCYQLGIGTLAEISM